MSIDPVKSYTALPIENVIGVIVFTSANCKRRGTGDFFLKSLGALCRDCRPHDPPRKVAKEFLRLALGFVLLSGTWAAPCGVPMHS